jgi:23S rRNA pseudouridine1911/1915/1917 synthase
LGHPVAGDKIYGPDPSLFLEYIERGWTSRLQATLPMRRHALHASTWSIQEAGLSMRFTAPPPEDFLGLLQETGLVWDS